MEAFPAQSWPPLPHALPLVRLQALSLVWLRALSLLVARCPTFLAALPELDSQLESSWNCCEEAEVEVGLPYRRPHLLHVGCGRLVPGWLRKCIPGSLESLGPPFLGSPELDIQDSASSGRMPRQRRISRQMWKRGEIGIRQVPDGACPWSR